MRMIGRDGIAVLPAAPVRRRNADIEYAYRQDSHFHYVTGFPEPEAVAVLVPGRPQGEYLLFVREHDAARESWDGPRAGTDGAVLHYDADDAFPIADIDEILPGLMEARPKIFYSMGVHEEFDPRMQVGSTACGRTRAGARPRSGIRVLEPFRRRHAPLQEPRGAEVDAPIRGDCRGRAPPRDAFRTARPHGIRSHGRGIARVPVAQRRPVYHPIVGGGANACVMHYRDNDKPLRDGDLLLLDAGCEYEYYASDITRTFPVGGRFSPAQRAVYEVVLEAQAIAIDRARPGNDWNQPHEAAVRAVTQGLVRLGLLKGRVARLIKERAYLEFFNHRTGHWLGIDVHDVGDYKVGGEWRVLETGMTLTVEPGIYIRPSVKIPREFWNIGIRIEDDVLVTAGAPDVLTAGLEKDPDAVERLVQA